MSMSVAPEAESENLDLDLFHFLLEHTPDQVYFKNRQGRFIQASRAVAEFLEMANPELVVGRTDFDLLALETARCRRGRTRALAADQPMIGKMEKVVHPDHRVAWD